MNAPTIYLHILWHQHQPWYPMPGKGFCSMPWVRLHGVKDYYDIAQLSEKFDGWKQTINLVPSLLEQIEGYVDGSITDEAFRISRTPAADLTVEDRTVILQRFFDAHAPRMIHPYPRYDELMRKRGASVESSIESFTTQDLLDLQVWFNLTWIDPVFLHNPDYNLHTLLAKQRDYTEKEKNYVLDLHLEIMKKIIPIHKELQQQGKLEITTTPYYHPILPLLCNTSIASVSNPYDPVPDPAFVHPEDAEWHINEGLKRFEQSFGFRPNGMWPSEGSVSDDACALIAKAGLNFFCTSQDILYCSTWSNKNHQAHAHDLFKLHRLVTKHGEIDCVFRDQELSDLIGFHYSQRDPKEAASHFIAKIKQKAHGWSDPVPPLVNVILDGENCWEFYQRDGHDFLQYLIEGILHDPQITPVTVPEYRERHPVGSPTLKSIFPGSWIAHNFRIWVGHPEDNAAWHYLRQARDLLASKESTLDPAVAAEAWKEIHVCEGSDWYWWFGDENSTSNDALFDEAFRLHLARIYTLLEESVPVELSRPIKRPVSETYKGAILLQSPDLSGDRNGYYDWVGSTKYDIRPSGGAMHQASSVECSLRFGRHQNEFCFLIELRDGKLPLENASIEIQVTKPRVKSFTIQAGKKNAPCRVKGSRIEGIVDLSQLDLQHLQEVWFFMKLKTGETGVTIPSDSELYLPAYSPSKTNPIWFL